MKSVFSVLATGVMLFRNGKAGVSNLVETESYFMGTES